MCVETSMEDSRQLDGNVGCIVREIQNGEGDESGQGSFDCATHSLREAIAALRMTGETYLRGLASGCPFGVVAGAVVEGLLGTYACSRKACVEVGAADGFLLCVAFA